MAAYLLAWTLSLVVYLLSSGVAGRVAYDAVNLMTAAAIASGIRMYRPRASFGWYLLVLSMVAFMGAGMVQDYYAFTRNTAAPAASWYDAVNLTAYGLLAAGIAVVIRARAGLSRQSALDALIFVGAFGSGAWELLVEPAIDMPGASLPARTISGIYPMVDVLLLGLLACLLFSQRRQSRAIFLLASAMAVAVTVDTAAEFSGQVGASWVIHWMQVGYLVALLCIGLAALHPSMVVLSQHRRATDDESGLGRLVGLGLALLLAPVGVCIQQYVQHRASDIVFFALVSAVLAPMVVVRMWWLLGDLRGRDGRFSALVQNSSDLTLVVDGDGVLKYVSPASWPILGLVDTQLNGTRLADLLHPDDRSGRLARVGSLALDNQARPEQVRMRCGDGTYRLMEAYLTDLSQEPTVRGIVANVRDITERTRLEAELRHAQKLESVGQLASGIAHEINTPIQFVGDNVRFLGDAFDELLAVAHAQPRGDLDVDFLAAEVPQAITQSLEGIGRMATIVRAMKAFGHPGTNKKTPTDINEAVRNTVVVAGSAIKKVADVSLDLGDLPPVWCHPEDVNQVLINLVVNACDAMDDKIGDSGERGTLTIRTAVSGRDVVIDVADTGTGVREEIAGHLFEPFFTTKDVGRGTGQGLALAYALIADRHRGTLSLTSTLDRGTTFTVRLPIAEPSTDRVAEPAEVPACIE